jgi:predicted O-linked N-acetylglucosamine transferase (SPINDLY family)
LRAYYGIDIALDTFPYNGTTTTCEALFMGVPVVTLAGRAHLSRVGASLLTRVNLAELIAQTHEEYARIAISLARDASRRREFGLDLRQRMLTSELMDCRHFTTDLEHVYLRMLADW